MLLVMLMLLLLLLVVMLLLLLLLLLLLGMLWWAGAAGRNAKSRLQLIAARRLPTAAGTVHIRHTAIGRAGR
uniref:Putative secreted protein n=1 Tax=Anopheles darlingi TaxID=43151 RepID=A0A2M4D2R2_ANODA